MKSPFVTELKANEIATAVFLVHSKEIRQKRTGEPYLSLLLSDRTGEMDAKMWDNVAEVMDTFDRDDFVKVKGILQLYNNRPQFTIHKLRLVQDHEVEFGDFFPCSLRDPEEMFTELRATIGGLTNPHIRLLLCAFLDDPEIACRYKIAPAAKSIHHAFRSGLLEHVISLCGLAKLTASHYSTVDLNLLIAGVVLHDIGKIYELSYERGFSYTPEGQLIGHIAIGARMFYDKLRAFPEFPPELRNLLEHMILSHHGQLEFGSPKVPIFPEALLLHYLDDMDSKMECMRALIAKEPQSEGYFTGYSSSLERIALRKSRYLGSENDAGAAPGDRTGSMERATSLSDAVTRTQPAPAETHPVTNGNSGTPMPHLPGRAPVDAPPNLRPAPALSSSPFGAKLIQALNDERK
ncbi:MAG: HD domain-containing protein [Acidobacteriota bacterium]|nr:HD domain-containing protein [Acidobacteriota bacterium]